MQKDPEGDQNFSTGSDYDRSYTLAQSTQRKLSTSRNLSKAAFASERTTGVCHLFVLHTTAALTIADLDPGTDLDLLDVFEALVPKLKYRHPHDPSHVGDHILSSLIGTSLCFPVKNGDPMLGTWQRIIVVELDGPRKREIALTFTREA